MTDSPLMARQLESPVGTLTLIASPSGLRAVLWPGDDPTRVRGLSVSDTLDADLEARVRTILDATASQLDEYFAGTRTEFDVVLDAVGTDFQREAWTALTTIPYGSTVSYGEQAALMGDRKKARAVGAANGRNPISIIVPCHRVVGSTGALTGFAGGIDTKAWLLGHERRVSGAALC